MANHCFTKSELRQYGLEDLSTSEMKEVINNQMLKLKNSQRQSKLQAVIIDNDWEKIVAHPKGPKVGLESFLYRDRNEMANNVSLDARIDVINNAAQNRLFDMMNELQPEVGFKPTNMFMDQKWDQQRDMLYAIFDETDKVKNSAYGKFAKDWNNLIEDLRVRFNKAGGDIKKLTDWRLPTHHDAALIGRAGFDKWFDSIHTKVDLKKMNLENSPTSEVREIFKKAYDNIVTDGVNESTKGLSLGTSKIGNRHQKARFFHFKDADSWMGYHKEFSESTPYAAMMDHVSMINTEIGLMEHLGPNPDNGFKVLADQVDKAENKAGASSFAKKAYDNLAGHLSPSPGTGRSVADFMQMIRNVTTGLKLPGAALAVPADNVFNAMTARYNGLPAMNVMKRYLSNLNPAKKEDQVLASRLWFTLDHMLDESHAAMRFSDVQGQKKSSQFASSIMKGSALSAMTVSGKKAFHYEFMAELGSGSYNKKTLAALERYGITGDEINVIKNSKKLTREGIDYLDPKELPTDLAERVVGMVVSEVKLAVPEADLMVRAMMNQGSKKGEVGGELLRFITQFKTFPATIMMGHWRRAMADYSRKTGFSRLGYMASMAVFTTAMGALVLQAKEIAKGNTPRDWDTNEFWTDAFLQGGAASILGDIMSSDSRSFGTSFQEFIMGPTPGMIDDVVWKGLLGSMDTPFDEMSFEKSAKGLVSGAADYVPYQFWYTKAIMNRAVLDSMRELGDPQYQLKQTKNRAEREQKLGNERYW